MDAKIANNKLINLKKELRKLRRVLVAFSGGVDSTFLLAVAHEVLSANAIAITEVSDQVPTHDLKDSDNFCRKFNIRHIKFNIDMLSVPAFTANPPDRCYICKKILFTNLLHVAAENEAILVDGSNQDDLKDYRPGLKALEELKILSPLQQVGLTKEEIRYLSYKMGLPTWQKAASACLASRFAFGEKITKFKLIAIDKAEQILYQGGCKQSRVRIHGNMVRIEVLPKELEMVVSEPLRDKICNALKSDGFKYVTLDLMGYRTGSMNEILKE